MPALPAFTLKPELLIAFATSVAFNNLLLSAVDGASTLPPVCVTAVVLALNLKFKPSCSTVMVELSFKLTVLLVLLTSVAVALLLLVIFQVLLTLFSASSTLV